MRGQQRDRRKLRDRGVARVVAAVGLSVALGGPAFAASPVAILLPGAGGATPVDVLMRNRDRITRSGIETIVTTSTSEAVAIAHAQRVKRRRTVIVGMSRGAAQAADAVAAGAPVHGVIFVSGNANRIMDAIGNPSRLPRTLVVHHRHDACPMTAAGKVEQLVRWGRGKVRVRWIDTRGEPDGRPCAPFGAHGFFMQDGPAISAIIGFVKRR